MIIIGLIAIAVIVSLNALPLAWLGMLAVGNLGYNVSFVHAFVAALALKAVAANLVTAPTVKK